MTDSSSIHILIVDDELASAKTLQRFFQNTDHLITVADNGIDALAILRKGPCDLIISDINMPEMDGIQLMQEALSDFPFLYFILITGNSCSLSFEDLTKAGALTCLAKPFKRSELMEIVDWVVDLKKGYNRIPDKRIDSIDRTKSLQMEKSLWNRDQRFQAIMNTAGDAIILIDNQGNISFWNPAAEVMFGYGAQEAIGKNLHAIITPEKDRKRAEIGFREFIKTGRGTVIGHTIEVTGLRKDQTEFQVELSLSGFKDQDSWHAAGIIRDITSRKEAEKSLLAANTALERAYQHLNQEYELSEKILKKVVRQNETKEKNVKYFLSTMDAVGGDLFITASGVPGIRHMLLGDFTGHGLSAALGAIPVTSIFYAMAKRGYSLRNIACEINNRLNAILPTELFFCACMVEWDYVHHIARILNFGLPDALLLNAGGVIKSRIPSRHLPLGILSEIEREYNYLELHLEIGDCIYLLTDGIIETQNKAGEQFGQERLEQLLTRFKIPEQRFDEICLRVNEFRGDTPQLDDLAIVEIKHDNIVDYHPVAEIRPEFHDLPPILSLSFTLDPDAMRTENFIVTLTDFLSGTHIAVQKQKENIFLIFSELYSNALEHGILRLETAWKNEPNGFEKYFCTRMEKLAALTTGWIKIDVDFFLQDTNGKIILHIEDSGDGFDYQNFLMKQPDTDGFGGRGLHLVRSLCKDVAIEGDGNKVAATFAWQ